MDRRTFLTATALSMLVSPSGDSSERKSVRRPPTAAAAGSRSISVRDFGAKGDGVADDTGAINRAIRAAAAGDTIYFPGGIYLVSNADLQDRFSTLPLPIGVNVLMAHDAWVKRKPGERAGIQGFFQCSGNNVLQVNIDGDEFPGSMTGAWPTAQSFGIYAPAGLKARQVTIRDSRFRNMTFGINAEDNDHWHVVSCDFQQLRGSGILMGATPGNTCSYNEIANCTFRDMGDTAVAFWQDGGATGEIAYNRVHDCSAKNTQHLTGGYAFDVESGFESGTQHHNEIVNNTVIQESRSSHSQGGITMGDYCEDSVIRGNVLRGNLNTTWDHGINISKSRNLLVEGNSIESFRGRAISADGATAPAIRKNTIRNCGSASGANSAIVLSELFGSQEAVVSDNELSWTIDYPFGGEASAAIYCAKPLRLPVRNVTIIRNTIRNPIDIGIYVFGTAGNLISGARIEDNLIIGEGGTRVFTRWPVYASYIGGLVLQNNTAHEARRGFSVSGSERLQMSGNVLVNRVTPPLPKTIGD